MAGHGRPSVEHPKIKKTTVRFSEEQDMQLNDATKYNLTKSQVLLKAFDLLMAKEKRKKD